MNTTNRTRSWRPRFSVRFLLVITALVAMYFATWQPTKRMGIPAVVLASGGWNATSPAPMLVVIDRKTDGGMRQRQAFAWLLGPVIRLPYSSGAQLPSPYYLTDDVQYFPPYPSFRLPTRQSMGIAADATTAEPESP